MFKWNGKHGDEFFDDNMKFRISVCELLVKDFSISSDQLIIDLYLELSKSSKETWGVYRNFHLFANEILNRNAVEYLDIYVEGATKSSDTGMASGRLDLEPKIIKEIIEELKVKTKKELNYEYMIKRFEYLYSKIR